MGAEPEEQELFDRWAETYDRDVSASAEFPLGGYDQVLASVVSRAEVRPSMSVLDLGTGTGNLAGLFDDRLCRVWATDFSSGMIARAKVKYPQMVLAVAGLQDSPPDSFPRRYDRIISAYAFHHLELGGKLELIQALAADHLTPHGRLVLADISFGTLEEREAARVRLADRWDSSEHYWAADETIDELQAMDLEVNYTQVSFCAGIFVVERKG